MLDTEWLYEAQESGHVLAWAREFARKRQAAGQAVWFAGVEEHYRIVQAAYAGAVLAEHLCDDGLMELRLYTAMEDRPMPSVALRYNGGEWHRFQVRELPADRLREGGSQGWLSTPLQPEEPPVLWIFAAWPEEDAEIWVRLHAEYVNASLLLAVQHACVCLQPKAETCKALAIRNGYSAKAELVLP